MTGDVVTLKRNPKLRVVQTPEEELAALFAHERDLLAALAKVREALDDARKRYAEANDLLAKPRMELLRTKFTPAKTENRP